MRKQTPWKLACEWRLSRETPLIPRAKDGFSAGYMKIKVTQLLLAAQLSCRLGMIFFFQNKVTRWYNPEQISYSFQSGGCTFGNGSFGLQPKIGLALNGTANLFPYRKSRFNLVKRNAIQASLRLTHSQGLSSFTRPEGQRPWERGFVAWQRGSTWHVIQVLQSQNSSWSTLLDT